MKLSLVVAVAALLALPVICRADLVIVQTVEGSPMQTGQMVIKIKGDKTRADISKQMSSVTDSATGDSVMIMHEQKSYMKMSADKTKALMEAMKKLQPAGAATPAEESVSSPKPTGKKQQIGAYATEEFSCQMGNMNIRYWVTKNFPNWEKLQKQMIKNQENTLSKMLNGKVMSLKDLPGMPVRTDIDFNGQKISSTIVSIKEEEVSPAEFEIPAGYTEMAMPSFPTGQP